MMQNRLLARKGIVLLSVMVYASCGFSDDEPGCSDCDVTGYWLGRYSNEEITGYFLVSIDQNGNDISGQFEEGAGVLQNASLQGTVKGGSISFSDGGAKIKFSGTVNQDLSATGRYSYPAAEDEGHWNASLVERGVFELENCFEIDSGVTALTHDGEHLWYIARGDIVKADESGQVIAEYETPTAGAGIRLAWGDGSIWYGHTDKIGRFDLDDQELELKQAEIDRTMESLAYADGALWVIEFGDEELVRLDDQYQKTESFELNIPHPTSMAFDGELFWIVDSQYLPSTDIGAVDLQGIVRGYHKLPEDFEVGGIAFDGQRLWIGSDSSISEPDYICSMTIK